MGSRGPRGALQEGLFKRLKMGLKNVSEGLTYMFKEEPLELMR